MSKTSIQQTSAATELNRDAEDYSTTPEFIYGGPFIKVEKPSPFLNVATPINLQLQGSFKKSFAYYSLKERMPVILTKVIDYVSREGSKIKSASGGTDDDLHSFIQYVSKLKNDLVTNKKYDLLTVDTPEAKRWNQWIESCDAQTYFMNTWVFSECYVYRRLREGCELTKGLANFDPFDEQKDQSFNNSMEPMCVVAEKLLTMLPESDKDKRKADFISLLKICLWSNKCDLSLSMGEQVTLKNEGVKATPSRDVLDPFQMILDLKDKVLVDDSAKIADLVVTRAESFAKAIEGNTSLKAKCSCNRLATSAGIPLCPQEEKPTEAPAPTEGEQPAELPPCPAKFTIPQDVMFDIVCDNSGYELFTDLCLAHFLIAQKVVQKVRFHVKKIPWFVSDVTPRDFKYVIGSCANGNYKREIPPETKPEPAEGEAPAETEPPRVISADSLRQLGEQWEKFVQDGVFEVLSDDFWTSPHVYKDMKRYDPDLYRKLQFATCVLFKGDLNYRKLLGEKNWNPMTGFEPALQGFMPAPVAALRTVKADLICGLPKGKADQLNALDAKWMEKGDYGVIQVCAKCEPLKVSERPCPLYGDTCRGTVCQ
ncbi:damage-control phosphatase ARMT1 isoform X1 [Pieris rapae]|uniref:damage-control phosphatase ARMT1 isoform X1 n=1 Tax=Pieris rapae TaxID=64459 RepID=UPI001E27B37E|nr:damage-control phosphatase ARMT1 isoform X1 [Pieris rapae]XP_022117267.2 damage-control phosphatase ARMT1 isoform X1 [Pieris rapae]